MSLLARSRTGSRYSSVPEFVRIVYRVSDTLSSARHSVIALGVPLHPGRFSRTRITSSCHGAACTTASPLHFNSRYTGVGAAETSRIPNVTNTMKKKMKLRIIEYIRKHLHTITFSFLSNFSSGESRVCSHVCHSISRFFHCISGRMPIILEFL